MPENAIDFAEKIRIYLDEPLLLKTHGENGYLYAKKYFDRKTQALQYMFQIEKHLALKISNTASDKLQHPSTHV